MPENKLNTLISKIEIFKDLDDKQVAKLAKEFKTERFNRNEHIYEKGAKRGKFYIIGEGSVEIYKLTPFGKEKTMSAFTKDEFFGEGAFLDDNPHATSARATTVTSLYTITREDFGKYMSSAPEVAVNVISRVASLIARRLRQTSGPIVDLAEQYVSGSARAEHDLLGDRDVPYEFYYGIQTLRAVENFNISGVRLSHFPPLVKALAEVKMAAAKANYEIGWLEPEVCNAIVKACDEIRTGKYHTHFVVDMIQGGAGTSTNMNANEVIANRALEIMGREKGEYKYCHPNNHVNLAQSTNDAYPTALKIALIYLNQELIEVLKELINSFKNKAAEFAHIVKMGRTQLQDAVPMTLGQEFETYAVTLEEEIQRLEQNARLFLEINMGGTAIGTGLNADPKFSERCIHYLWEITGLPVKLATNLVEATQDTGSFVIFSSAVKRLAVKLSKICNDLRLLSSGPRCGLNEINLPKMQPGSSIMPGKVNPVIPEVVNQIAFKVIGNDLTVTLAAEAGQLQLNVMEPIIAQSIIESIDILKNGMSTLKYRCIDGITANEDVCRGYVENSIGLVTALNPYIGYENATSIAQEALMTGKRVYDLVLERKLLSKEKLDMLMQPENMISPHTVDMLDNGQ
ncbi:MAG: aspartate ammonia-lyase [Chloroflexota bacterium]